MENNERLISVETDLRWVKITLEKNQTVLERLAEDLHKLTRVQLQQIEDRKAMDRVEELQKRQSALIDKAFEQIELTNTRILKKQNEERGKTINNLVATVLTVATTLISAYILKKLGLTV